MTVLEYLERCLQPKYVGWQDQYKAILNVLGIQADTPWQDVKEVMELL